MSTKNEPEVRFSISMSSSLREMISQTAKHEKRTMNLQLNYYIELGIKAEKEGMRLLEQAS